MKKSIEDAAREYAEGSYSHERTLIREEAFIAGDANGYARAIEESVEGFEEWFESERGGKVLPHHENQMITAPQRDLYRWEEQAWQASRLSSQKELAEPESHKIMLNAQIDDLEKNSRFDRRAYDVLAAKGNTAYKELEGKLKVVTEDLMYIEDECGSYGLVQMKAKEALAKIRGEQKDTDNE